MTKENEREIQLVKLFANSMTKALGAMERMPSLIEEKIALNKEIKELKAQLKVAHSNEARYRRHLRLIENYSPAKVCTECDGHGGFEFEAGEFGEMDYDKCPACNEKGFIHRDEEPYQQGKEPQP